MMCGFRRNFFILPAIVLWAGCNERIDSEYGKQSGLSGGPSVNGTAVLAEMIEQADHEVNYVNGRPPGMYRRLQGRPSLVYPVPRIATIKF